MKKPNKPKLLARNSSSGPKLTTENYRSPKRLYVSYSQIADYLKSPRLYEARYVTKTLERDAPTPAMTKGSAFDAYVTGVGLEKFFVGSKRECPEGREPITEDAYLEVLNASEYLKSLSFWKELAPTLEYQIPYAGVERGVLICGLVDAISITQRVILDLKYVSPQVFHKFHFRGPERFYHVQALLYADLAAKYHSEDYPTKLYSFRFLNVVCTTEDGLPRVRLYEYDHGRIDEARTLIFSALEGIKAKDFTEEDPSLSDVPMITPYGIADRLATTPLELSLGDSPDDSGSDTPA